MSPDLRLAWCVPKKSAFGDVSPGQPWQRLPNQTHLYLLKHAQMLADRHKWPAWWVEKIRGMFNWSMDSMDVLEAGVRNGPGPNWQGSKKWYEFIRFVATAVDTANKEARISSLDNMILETMVLTGEDIREGGEKIFKAAQTAARKASDSSSWIALTGGLLAGGLGLAWIQRKFNLR